MHCALNEGVPGHPQGQETEQQQVAQAPRARTREGLERHPGHSFLF